MFDNIRNMLNFDDLLFEKRNKEYGAYQLRKRYNSVVFTSLVISVLLFSTAIILPFIIKPDNEKIFAGGFNYTSVNIEIFEPPEDEIYVPPAAPPPPSVKIQEVVKYTPPVIVDTIVPVQESMPTSDELAAIPPDDIDYADAGSGDNLLGIEGGIATGEPFAIVEIMPSFKGGDINKFRLWVQQRTNYPQLAIDKNIKGKVVLTFIVETDGSVSNVTLVQSIDSLIDIEAIKAIESSPKWTPGLQRGQPVRVRYVIPLVFSP